MSPADFDASAPLSLEQAQQLRAWFSFPPPPDKWVGRPSRKFSERGAIDQQGYRALCRSESGQWLAALVWRAAGSGHAPLDQCALRLLHVPSGRLTVLRVACPFLADDRKAREPLLRDEGCTLNYACP